MHGYVQLVVLGDDATSIEYVRDPGGSIGTTTVEDRLPETLPGEFDQGMVGGYGVLTEHQGSVHTLEMGVRQYVPGLGRFLSVDPVSAGAGRACPPPTPGRRFSHGCGGTRRGRGGALKCFRRSSMRAKPTRVSMRSSTSSPRRSPIWSARRASLASNRRSWRTVAPNRAPRMTTTLEMRSEERV